MLLLNAKSFSKRIVSLRNIMSHKVGLEFCDIKQSFLPAATKVPARLKRTGYSAVAAFSAGVEKWAARSSEISATRNGKAGGLATSASLTVIADSGSSQERIGCYLVDCPLK